MGKNAFRCPDCDLWFIHCLPTSLCPGCEHHIAFVYQLGGGKVDLTGGNNVPVG